MIQKDWVMVVPRMFAYHFKVSNVFKSLSVLLGMMDGCCNTAVRFFSESVACSMGVTVGTTRL